MKRVVIAGLGTVGGGVYTILTQQKERLARELGGEIRVEAVLVRDTAKHRTCDVPPDLLTDDPDILLSSGADALLEATGDTALGYKLARVAMDRGMHVITAGKALVSGHMEELHALAHERGLYFLYEASVCGGIPLLKAAADLPLTGCVRAVRGIMNGSTNHILSAMTGRGCEYEDLVREAREMGYLEADAGDDLLGYDARRKLRILATLALGGSLAEESIICEGISRIRQEDVKALGALGYTVKLIAGARRLEIGAAASVFPWALPGDSMLAGVNGAGNYVEIEEQYLGKIGWYGPGAGALPTAHAMAGDLMDALAGRRPLTAPIGGKPLAAMPGGERACFYLRGIDPGGLPVRQPLGGGVLTEEVSFGDVMALLRDHPAGAAIAVDISGRYGV